MAARMEKTRHPGIYRRVAATSSCSATGTGPSESNPPGRSTRPAA
jgi:hypothetical protein